MDVGLDCYKPTGRRKYTNAPYAVRADRLLAVPDGMLLVSCWCEENEVLVEKELVGVSTRSCGLRDCYPVMVPSRVVRSNYTKEVAPGASNTEGLAATPSRRELA